jgi:integrase
MAEKVKWYRVGSKEKGYLYYKKHPTKKNGVRFDKYYRTEYQFNKKRIAINFGWQSNGWTENFCFNKLDEYKNNAKKGKRPISLKDEREMDAAKKKNEEKQIEEKQKGSVSINNFFYQTYYPLIQKEKKTKTHQREESLFRNWIDKSIGSLPFKKASKADIENIFYDVVDSGKSIRTAEYALTTLKQIWREAQDNNFAPVMPIISKSLRKKINNNNNSRIRFLSYKEAKKLLKVLQTSSISLYEKTLISLHCGLRASEIFRLTWAQVDLEHGIFNIIDSKGADRSVYMSKQVKKIFKCKTQDKPNILIFPGRDGKISKQISNSFQKIANKLFNDSIDDNRHKVVFHTCRHTSASWMVMQGVSLYVVQKVLGHSTIQVTERYSHLAPDQLQLAANAIDRTVNQYKEKNIIPFQQKA